MNYNNLVQVDYSNDIWVPSSIINGRVDILQNQKNTSQITRKPILTDDNNINSICILLYI